MVRILKPAGAPSWLQPVVQSIERAFRDQRLEEFTSTTLPPAADHRGKLVLVTNLNMVAVSTGTGWIRLDTGATL